MFAFAAVCTAVNFNGLGISILFPRFCLDMPQFSAIMANVIMLILKDPVCHVIILADIFFVCTGLPFLMILQLDIAVDVMFLLAANSEI